MDTNGRELGPERATTDGHRAAEPQPKELTTDGTDATDGKLKKNPWSMVSLVPAHHTLPCQLRLLEIQQQRQLQPGDVQIAEHLGVRVVERRQHFRVRDHLAIDEEIRNQLPDEVAPVVDWIFPLLLHGVTTRH